MLKKILKKYKVEIYLTILFIVYVLLTTGFGKYLYGSVLDWNCQHYYIPDYFRKLFYETGKLFPNFAFNLGAGQNIYNLSYYGLLSPIILFSYLLPFISMKSYIQFSSILLSWLSIILFYRWINKKFDFKIAIVSTLVFMFSSALLFHSHRHIMFVNYIPFLILALSGVDIYFNKRKKSLLMFSVFLIAITSYFFSVGSLVVIVIYGVYCYISINKKIDIKDFFRDGFKFLLPIITGLVMSLPLLLPTFLAILNGRGKSSVSVNFLNLIIPRLNLDYILYNTYSVGLTAIIVFSLIYVILRGKRQNLFLGTVLSMFILFPLLNFLLNGGMYVSAKVLIPFLPLFVFIISLTLKELLTNKENIISCILVYILICLYIIIMDRLPNYFVIDAFLVLTILIFYNYKKMVKVLLIGVVVLSISSFCCNSTYDNLVLKDHEYDLSSTDELIEQIKTFDSSFYRITNRNGGLGTSNDIKNINYYQNSIYSSVSNQNYQNFYYNLIGNDILNRSKGQLSNPKNLLFNIYMNNKYMIGPYSDELGYNLVKNIDNNYLYQNNDVLPLGYSKNKIMSLADYEKLEYPYNVEALLNYIIVDGESSSEYYTNIKRIDFKYNISDIKNLTMEKQQDYLEINSLKDGKLLIDLDENLDNKIIFIRFELLDSNNCSVGDNSISINDISNKLTCKDWKYNNGNYIFEYTISQKNLKKLDVRFDKGNYKIKNIEVYSSDYNEFVAAYKDEVSEFVVDINSTKGDQIEGTIMVEQNGYFNISIPYDKGFTIYVDEKKVDYINTDISFIGFKLNKGKHNIRIIYNSPGLKLSKCLSLIAIIIFLSNLYIEYDKSVNIKERYFK